MIELLDSSVRAFRKQRSAFFADAAVVLKQGVKFQDCLKLKKDFNNGKPLGIAYDEIQRKFTGGDKLSKSFERYLPITELQALEGWDQAKSDNQVAEGFSVIGELAKAFDQIQAELKKSLSKTTFAFLLVFFILWSMHSSIYPSIIQNFPVVNWGITSRIFYYFVNILFANILILIIGITLVVIVYIWSLKNWSSYLRRKLDNTVIYGWWKSFRSLSVLMSLALSIKSNPSVNGAIRKAMKNAGEWEYYYLQEMLNKNNSGAKGGEVFNVGFFDIAIIERILMLSTSGSSEKALETIALGTQKELLEMFKLKIEKYGNNAKNCALILGAMPVILFFVTVGEYILQVVSGTS